MFNLRHCFIKKPVATVCNFALSQDSPDPVHRSARYQKVLDGRKHEVRGFWQRNGRFIGRIEVEIKGHKINKWVNWGDEKNPVMPVPQAIKALNTLRDNRDKELLKKELAWKCPTRQLVSSSSIERLCAVAFEPLFSDGAVVKDGQPGSA